MDFTWKGLIVASVLVGLASSEVTITSVEPLWLGDYFNISCRASSKISQCLWEVNGRLIELNAADLLRPAPSSSEMECVVEAEATEDLDGSLFCIVFTESCNGIPELATTTVSIISVPDISLSHASESLSVTAGEEKEIICKARDMRVPPNESFFPFIVWMIGDQEVNRKHYITTPTWKVNGTTVNFRSILRRKFVALEHNKELQCIVVTDVWLQKKDNTVAQTRLDVQFPPMPQSTITMYGLKENKPGEVRVTVQANPRPHRAFWILPTPSSDKLEVEKQVDGKVDNNYLGHSGEDNGNGTYTYRLSIDSVEKQDSNPGIKFQLFNRVVGIEKSQQYLVKAITSPHPEQVSPMPQSTIAMYGREENKQGEVQVTVQANPRPYPASLPSPSNNKLEVKEKRSGTVDNNYVGHVGEDKDNLTYPYHLRITSDEKQDSNAGIKFQVINRVGDSEQFHPVYVVHPITSPQPGDQAMMAGFLGAGFVVMVLLGIGMCWLYKRIGQGNHAQFPTVSTVVHPGSNPYDNHGCYISHSDIHLPPLPITNLSHPAPRQYLNVNHLYSSESDHSSSVGPDYDDVANPHIYEKMD